MRKWGNNVFQSGKKNPCAYRYLCHWQLWLLPMKPCQPKFLHTFSTPEGQLPPKTHRTHSCHKQNQTHFGMFREKAQTLSPKSTWLLCLPDNLTRSELPLFLPKKVEGRTHPSKKPKGDLLTYGVTSDKEMASGSRPSTSFRGFTQCVTELFNRIYTTHILIGLQELIQPPCVSLQFARSSCFMSGKRSALLGPFSL